ASMDGIGLQPHQRGHALRRLAPLGLLISLTAVAHSLAIAPLRAEEGNWPQWRGPLMTGVSPSADPPVTWDEKTNIKWKVKIPGRGLSTPLIWGDQVFIQTAIPVANSEAAPAAKPDSSDAKADDKADEPDSAPPAAKGDAPRDGNADRPPPDRNADGPPPGGRADSPPPRGRGNGPPRGFGRGGMMSRPPKDPYQFVLLCLDRATGKTHWQKVAREEVPHEGTQFDNTFASNSPVTDGKCVVAYFGSRGLHCYDMQGNLKWEKDLGRMKTKLSFGEGSSPAMFGNTVVVNWDHEGPGFIAAFDKETGNELWRTPREEETSWTTPIVVERSGKAELITAATRKIRSYDLADGTLLWECAGLTTNAIPTPVAGNGLVYATTGFRGYMMLAIRPDGNGDVTGTDAVAWTLKKGTPYVPSPLLYDDRLYFFAGNNAILSCINAKTGEPLYDGKRIEDLQGVYASPVGASGRVYLIGRNGTTVVIKHADTLETLATNHLDERFDASPALAGKELFLRGHDYLYCIAEK
ncbi:MAG TPA: PQQ-binding-like beta-propeller repeat protein, partial [Pirellulales bacterium]|nr:PQQ-binding-like beta-propeller repeat protein [Pirellulales bacterium]